MKPWLPAIVSVFSLVHLVPASDHTFEVCQNIRAAISRASAVHYPGSVSYAKDISHDASSSAALATCAVEPGTADDVATIIKILGTTRTPFAVKGGGHAYNPHFSSTTGVQIAMYKFNQINYDPATNTVEVGAGLVWNDVYAALQPHNVTVVGGRIPGVGVAGLTLGGGYSWHSNQHGLAVDNVVAYELVLPTGTVTSVTQSHHPDLFWALKGGFNNFGIVTAFILKAHPQPSKVWAGSITYDQSVHGVNSAVVKFTQTVTDPKATILLTHGAVANIFLSSVLMFYDGPTPPAGMFDDMFSLPSLSNDVKTRTFADFVQSLQPNSTNRRVYHTLCHLKYTDTILEAARNETQFWGRRLANASATTLVYGAEPFLPSLFSHAPEGSSAYPPSRARALLPFGVYYDYMDESADEVFYDAVRQSVAHLTRVAIDEGQDIADAALYGNYAIHGTPLERIYGKNLDRLTEIKNRYDPHEVMNLAGGWRF